MHRFGKRGRNGARPIVAMCIYRREFEDVLKNAFKLRGEPFGRTKFDIYVVIKQ
jgi:hypothetical protein